MKIKVIVENVGDNHARLEMEDDCEVNGIGRLLEKLNRELSGDHVPASSFAKTNPAMRNGDGDDEPASGKAINALWAAAQNNETDVESVCREYGVDPKHVSKRDFRQMTHDLNERSGCRKQ